MKITTPLFSLGTLLPQVMAGAFVGLGKVMYNPSCAHACRYNIQSNLLSCSMQGGMSGMHMGHSSDFTTTPACRAGNLPFLTTLAYCMNTTCTPFDVQAWELEKFWKEKSTPSTGEVAVTPRWTYFETLELITVPPTKELKDSEELLDFTAVTDPKAVHDGMYTLEAFEYQEAAHARYGLVLLLVGVSIPIIFAAFEWLPGGSAIADRLNPYLQRSTFGKTHVQALHKFLGNVPTLGQTFYISLYFVLNIIFAAVDYPSFQPNTWFSSTWQEVMAYVSCRTGVLAFAIAPLVFLFAGRNNILLWVTNWSHSTFILLHRWIARIFTLQVVVHSIVELVLYMDMLGDDIASEQAQPYWVWGIVGTLASCIMVVISVLYFRRLSYEVFLIVHIILAALVLVGSWYHVELLFNKRWGYEFWLYACFAVWAFDRVLRVVRIVKVGARRSNVSEVGPNIVRVDVEGVRWPARPGHHAYIYFPALNPLKPWENHPFSVVPTAMLSNLTSSTAASDASSTEGDIEKIGTKVGVASIASQSLSTSTGVSFFIRKSKGMTKRLIKNDSVVTLLDGPYKNNRNSSVLQCDRVLLIGGGIGITALLPYLRHHVNVKLFWSVKQANEQLVQTLDPAISSTPEKDVRVGARFDVNELLSSEVKAGWKRIGVCVCGPPSLCDDVRAAVTKTGRQGTGVFELEVDAFSW